MSRDSKDPIGANVYQTPISADVYVTYRYFGIEEVVAATVCSADGLWQVAPTFSYFFIFISRFNMIWT